MTPFASASTRRSFVAVAVLAAACSGANLVRAQSTKPAPWHPKPAGTAVTAPAPAASYDTLRTPDEPPVRTMPLPPGVTPTIDAMYQPSVADSILPFVPYYAELRTTEQLTGYLGALRQGSAERLYPVLLADQTVHAEFDAGPAPSHVAIFILVPWFGKILPLPSTEATLALKVDGGPEQKFKLLFAPGPNLYTTGQRPLPVSNPGLTIVPVSAGRHKIEVKIKDLNAQYAFLMMGQPVMSPLPILRGNDR